MVSECATRFVDTVDRSKTSTKHLFFIEKIGKNGSRTYRLIRTFLPCWQKILCKIKTLFLREQHHLINHRLTLQILSAAANERKGPQYSDALTKFTSLKNLQQRAQLFKNLETASHRKNRVRKQGMAKFYQAVDKAKIIGKGICEAETKGYQPLTLDPLYVKELTSQKPNASVQLLSPVKRLFFAVECHDGKLLRRGKVYDSTEGKEITKPMLDAFVISPNEHLYAGAIQVGRFHHSSFLSCGAVLFAGELATDSQGKMTKLTNRSGHYKPQRAHLLQALRWFEARGIDIATIELHEYDISRPNNLYIHTSAKNYLHSHGLCQPNQTIKI